MQNPIVNAFTIDVEDYFQVAAFDSVISRDEWDTMECRVERNIDHLLAILERTGTHATFFTLGWIAQRYPDMVRRISDHGHEIASHGFAHKKATEQPRDELREDVNSARKLLQDLTGQPVNGYRAPSFSVGEGNLWIHDVLAQSGYQYSSSIYPISHDHYGMPNAPRFAFNTDSGLTEIPATSIRVGERNFPASGGGYFRLLPYAISRWSIRRVNGRDKEPAIFYCHPWEVDPEQPRITQADMKARFRHYLNLDKTSGRIERLLGDFRWDRMDRVFESKIGVS